MARDEIKLEDDTDGGKVVETRGALARIAKAETPDKPLFIAGGPEQPGFPKQQ